MQNNHTLGRPIHLLIAGHDARRWIAFFREALVARGHCVTHEIIGNPGGNDLMLALCARGQSAILGRRPNYWALDSSMPAKASPAPSDALRLAISAGMPQPDFTLWLGGKEGTGPLGRALMAGQAPFAEWRDRHGKRACGGLPAIEFPERVSSSLRDFALRLATLAHLAIHAPGRSEGTSRPLKPSTSPLLALASGIALKVIVRAARSRLKNDHWRVAIRPVRPGDAPPSDLAGFRWLEDDGARYYADPILWEEQGRAFLFVEEFPYATERGLISVTELAPDGRALDVPRPIIERRTHLSYPFLFRHEGAIYMMPENAAEGHLPLYRARQFPDIWEECQPLVPDRGLHDATLLAHQGQWWLLANEECDGGSSWDCLSLFRGNSPLGPFLPVTHNPALVDARLARSAGPVLQLGGHLVRPIQNCVGGYGRSLVFAEIEQLDDTDFRQQEISELKPPAGAAGLHTYSRSGRFEAIDMLTPRGARPAL